MNKIRAKFRLTATKHEDDSMNVTGNAVTDGCEENKVFSEFTPSGSFDMHISAGKEAQNNFPIGETKEFYIDITPAN